MTVDNVPCKSFHANIVVFVSRDHKVVAVAQTLVDAGGQRRAHVTQRHHLR